MASNIIDALVCLIEAKGEFVSSARLKDMLWPDAISSDADVQSYMSALQGALEGRSKPETYMERNPERGLSTAGECSRGGCGGSS
jgi:DNA-binding winged helix-turn-helix (wHTH) protein